MHIHIHSNRRLSAKAQPLTGVHAVEVLTSLYMESSDCSMFAEMVRVNIAMLLPAPSDLTERKRGLFTTTVVKLRLHIQ